MARRAEPKRMLDIERPEDKARRIKCLKMCREWRVTFAFVKLPRELQFRILRLTDARALLELSRTSKTVRDLCFKPAVLSHHIAGMSFNMAFREERHLTLDEYKAHFLFTTYLARAEEKDRDYLWGQDLWELSNRRFRALFTSTHVEIRDRFYDKPVLHEALKFQLTDGDLRRHFFREVSFWPTFAVMITQRRNDAIGSVGTPDVFAEYFQIGRSDDSAALPARVTSRRELGFPHEEGMWHYVLCDRKEFMVVKQPQNYPDGHVRPPSANHRQATQFWAESSILNLSPDQAQAATPWKDLDGMRSADRGWSWSLLAPGIPEDTLHPIVEARALTSYVHLVDADAFGNPYDPTLSRKYPVDWPVSDSRASFHVWDTITQREIAWPAGSALHFSKPNPVRMEYSISAQDGSLRLRDGMGNLWKCARGSAIMQSDRSWKRTVGNNYHPDAINDDSDCEDDEGEDDDDRDDEDDDVEDLIYHVVGRDYIHHVVARDYF